MEKEKSKKIDGNVGGFGVKTGDKQFEGALKGKEVELDLTPIGKISILETSQKEIMEIMELTDYGKKEAISLLIDWGVLSYISYKKELKKKVKEHNEKNKKGTKIIVGKDKGIIKGRKILY